MENEIDFMLRFFEGSTKAYEHSYKLKKIKHPDTRKSFMHILHELALHELRQETIDIQALDKLLMHMGMLASNVHHHN